jgi:hypothetical protein
MDTTLFVPLTEDEYRRLMNGAYHNMLELETLIQRKLSRTFSFSRDFADEMHRIRFLVSAPYLSRKYRDGDTISTTKGWVFSIEHHTESFVIDESRSEVFVLKVDR